MQKQIEHTADWQAWQKAHKPTPIAIIGMGFRFPGHVHDEKSMWSMLTSGTSAITELPESRWPVRELRHPDRSEPGRSVTFAAGVLDNVLGFDAGFFGISPIVSAKGSLFKIKISDSCYSLWMAAVFCLLFLIIDISTCLSS